MRALYLVPLLLFFFFVDAEEVPRHLQFLSSKAAALRELNKDLGHISSRSHVRSPRQASFLSGAANGFVRGTRALVRNAQKRVSGERRGGKELKIVSVLRNILRTPFKAAETSKNRRQHNRQKKVRPGPLPQHRPHHNQRNPRIPLPFSQPKKHHHKRQNHKRKNPPPPSFALTAPNPPQPQPPRGQTFPSGPRPISLSSPPKRNAGPISAPDQTASFTRVPEQGSRPPVQAPPPDPQTHQVVFKAPPPEETVSSVSTATQGPSSRENTQVIIHSPHESSNYEEAPQPSRFSPPQPHQIIQMTDLGADNPTVQVVDEPRYTLIEPTLDVEPIDDVEDNFIYDLTENGVDVDAVAAEGLLPGGRVTLSTYEADELYRSQPHLFRSEKLVQDVQPDRVHENHQYDVQDINLLSQAVQAAMAQQDNPGVYSSYDAEDVSILSQNSIDDSGNNAYSVQNLQDNTLESQYESYDNIEDKDLLSPDIPDSAVSYKYVQLNEKDLYPQASPVTIHTPPLSKGTTGIQTKPADHVAEEKSLEVDISPEDFNASINRVITDSDFVSLSYERLLDEKIEEIKREAAKLEQTYWGGKSNDYGIKK